MMWKRMVGIGLCGLAVLAVGASPRYLEELCIGGGFGEPVDGGADLDKAGNISTDGELKAVAGLEAGKDSAARGIATLWDGSGNAAPGCLKLGTTNGTAGYVFLSNDRTGLRISSSLPISDTDGDWVKAKTVTDLNAPPPIGNWTPNTGRFTTLNMTGVLNVGSPAIVGSTLTSPQARFHVLGAASGFSGARNYRLSKGALFESDSDEIVELQGSSAGFSEIWFGDSDEEAVGRVRYNHAMDAMEFWADNAAKVTINADGNIQSVGDITASGGDITAGAADQTRGVLSACAGAGITAPGVLKLISPNGTARYFFADDSGAFKVHSALPTGNSSGTVVGDQTSSTIVTITTNDTTPSVSGGVVFRVPGTWTSGHNITMFDDGVAGQRIVVIGGDSDCVVVDGTHVKLAGNWTGAVDKTLSLVFDGTDWFETARSDN